MTSKNSPSVNIVMGNVNNIRIGLTTTLIIAKTAATMTAIRKFATFIPGNSQQVKYMIPAYENHLINKIILMPLA